MRAMTASGTVPSTIVGRMRCDSADRKAPLSSGQQRVDQQEAGDRLDEILHGDAARDRRPAELHREQQDQQQAPPEDRHRIAGERDAHHAVVEDRVAPHRRDDAGRQAEDEREQDRAERELDGRRKQRREFRDHRLMRDDRVAEIALQHAADVDAVLHEHRLVEAVLLAQLRMPDRIDAALAGHGLDRIAGNEADQDEGEQRDPDEGRNDEADPGEDEAEHRGMIMRRTGAGPRSWNRRPTVRARRRRGMPPPRRWDALLDVDAVEGVAAERRELEVDDFLAHRLQLHGVRDGEPGRLLLEDRPAPSYRARCAAPGR